MTRILFHVGDSPCHGRRFYTSANDHYPDGDPRGLDINKLMKDIVHKNIDYYFAEINGSTKKMIDEFNQVLLDHQGREIKCLKLSSADDLFESVSLSITTSIMNSKSLSMHDAHGKPIKNFKLHRGLILWSDLSKFNEFSAESFEMNFSCSDLKNIKHETASLSKVKVNV